MKEVPYLVLYIICIEIPFSRPVVTYSIDAGPRTSKTATPELDSQGRPTWAIRLNTSDLSSLAATSELQAMAALSSAGSVIKIFSIEFMDEQGKPVEGIPPMSSGEGGSRPMELVIPPSQPALVSSASATSRASRYRTWVSSQPDPNETKLTKCPGPFRFRIQKEKTTRPRGKGQNTATVTWTDLPKKYKTNKKSGSWHYRTVNLKKGTYRSVIYGKCGLLSATTRPVAIKR